ncbi:MAG TPA: regulatory protein RecX [Gammaproteobacteria bacterium]|nr:regulatory protein RecX [Gammaproteobacteria bacterium]
MKEPADSAPPPRNVAMNCLARREHSIAELRTKLAARDYKPEDIETTLKTLAAEGLVSDERFAESFVAARMRKGQGPVRIRMELKKRGVAAETIRLHVNDSALDWHTLAREVRSKKFGTAKPFEFTEKARQMRFLEYRGFTGEQISQAVGED